MNVTVSFCKQAKRPFFKSSLMNNYFAGYSDLLVQFITDSDERAYIYFFSCP